MVTGHTSGVTLEMAVPKHSFLISDEYGIYLEIYFFVSRSAGSVNPNQ